MPTKLRVEVPQYRQPLRPTLADRIITNGIPLRASERPTSLTLRVFLAAQVTVDPNHGRSR